MAVFGVKTQDVASARRFIDETKQRFKGDNIINNPFTAWLKTFEYENTELITVVSMRPLWPNFAPWVALLCLFPILMFGWVTSWTAWAVPLFFLVLGFFWTEDFFYLMFVLGLRKAGYKGPVKKVKRTALIEELARRI